MTLSAVSHHQLSHELFDVKLCGRGTSVFTENNTSHMVMISSREFQKRFKNWL